MAGNDTIDDVLDRLEVGIRINAPLPGNVLCQGNPSHPLMAERASIDWFASNTLEMAPPGAWLDCGALAVQSVSCGEVVVVGDLNPVSDRPERAAQCLETWRPFR